MPAKTILLYLGAPETAARTLKPAVALARRCGAHLIGLHVTEGIEVYAGVSVFAGAIDTEVVSAAAEARRAEIKAAFDAAVVGEDFVAEWRHVEAGAHTASDRIIEHARAADLVVLGQARPNDPDRDAAAVVQRTIRKCGRPVLVVPYAGSFEEIGRKALIGWSPTREAARAAHDAIPLLEGGEAMILTAHSARDPNTLGVETAKELALNLARHGVKAEVVERTNDGIAVGDLLENESFERGADLIVTGAFGHSRVYDFVIGATTTHLLDSMTAPVLFSS
ncbi:MAG: universal stress protein [Pseudomonadota bacterium]